jgi:hypothetical protein
MARTEVTTTIEIQNEVFDLRVAVDDMKDVYMSERIARTNRKGWVGVVYSGDSESDLLGSSVNRPWIHSEDEADPELLAEYKIKYAEWYAYNRKDIDTKRIIIAKAVQAGLAEVDLEDLKWSGNDYHFKTTKRGVDIWLTIAPLGYFTDMDAQIEAKRVAGKAAKADSIRKALEIFNLAPEIDRVMIRIEGWSSPFWYNRSDIKALDENCETYA